MKKWFQYTLKDLSDLNKFLETNGAMYGVLGAGSFMVTFFGFHPESFIERNGSIISMFFLPIIIWGCLFVITRVKETSDKVWPMAPKSLRMISWGAWVSMVFVGVITVDKWFRNPDNGQLEPYFIATTLSAAAVFSAFKKLDALIER